MLTKTETKRLVKLLGKIENPYKGLPQEIFIALTKLVPFISCEVVLVHAKKEILLTWRNDQWWTGWHLPGGLMRLGESFKESLRNTAKRELGIRLTSFEFLFLHNYQKGQRGHAISLVFLCRTNQKPNDGKFFKTMPEDLIAIQKPLWHKLKRLV